jgi:hypothetical protein
VLPSELAQQLRQIGKALESREWRLRKDRETIKILFLTRGDSGRLEKFAGRYLGAFNIRLVKRINANFCTRHGRRVLPEKHVLGQAPRNLNIGI